MRNTVAREMFRDTADHNYVAARWCFLNGLNTDFYWLSLHALEKYLKTVLLLNGRPVRKYGHDIVALYRDIGPIAASLMPQCFRRPLELDVHWWHEDLPDTFIDRLSYEGCPDNRYQVYGYRRWSDDLIKVDQITFAMRRLCWPLDTYVIDPDGKPDAPTFRDILNTDPNFWSFKAGDTSPLYKIFDGKLGSEIRATLLDNNFSFAPDDYQHPDFQEQQAFSTTALLRYVYDPLKGSHENARTEAKALREWVKGNIQLPSEFKAELDSW
ncbi:MAG: hypothetical protein WD076_03245 [Parvularculaceae bacterium]